MDATQYKSFYERVGALNGWDFSKLKCRVVGREWDFYGEVRKRCRRSDLLLDIGTGGERRCLP
ncbi:hypothetical protein LJK88_18405 [Paenibacillus sp. P26]|nr:hypothetical protein LJK88_18405 [Paenibacillus sp. P26]UUZ96295.1 hypothetical protein LJK87_19415 [Paenibacillus sp. P25]